jgi:hypothetical protein
MPKRKYTRRRKSTWPIIALPDELRSVLMDDPSHDVRLRLPSGMELHVSLAQLGGALDLLRERSLCRPGLLPRPCSYAFCPWKCASPSIASAPWHSISSTKLPCPGQGRGNRFDRVVIRRSTNFNGYHLLFYPFRP